ncbi:MAG: hypothetical protein L6R40_001073 [Gallowayella cf. fulva]|nr:MAG: hypothetical protein L6R40_001073 [Xanthomendoza cf. fulva]
MKEEAAMGDLQESSSKVFDGPTSKADQVVPDVEPFFPFDQIVTVLVGPDRERFSIHKRLICQYPFFKTAYDGGFRESADSVVELPEHDPAIFRFFVYWLYTGKLYGHFYPQTAKPSISDIRKECQLQWQDWQGTHLPHYTTRSGKQLNNDRGQLYRLLTYRDAPFDALIGLYLLTEYLQIPGLRDEITNILVDVYANANDKLEGVSTSFWRWRNYSRPQWAPDPVPSINAAWTSSHQDSNLCRLLVTLFCDNVVLNAEEVQENERLDTEFLSAAFTMAQKRWSSGSARSSWVGRDSLCPYHEHDGNNCEFNNEKMAKA